MVDFNFQNPFVYANNMPAEQDQGFRFRPQNHRNHECIEALFPNRAWKMPNDEKRRGVKRAAQEHKVRPTKRICFNEEKLQSVLAESIETFVASKRAGDLESAVAANRRALSAAEDINDINVTNQYGNTFLHLACNSHMSDLVQLLLSRGVEIKINGFGDTPLHTLLKSKPQNPEERQERIRICTLLFDENIDIGHERNQEECSAFMYACMQQDIECAKILLQKPGLGINDVSFIPEEMIFEEDSQGVFFLNYLLVNEELGDLATEYFIPRLDN